MLPELPWWRLPFHQEMASKRPRRIASSDSRMTGALARCQALCAWSLAQWVRASRRRPFCKPDSSVLTAVTDQWLEEDIPVYVHPKDPFKRIDILPSSRPIEVRVGGKTVAKAASSVHLHETGLPTRYYISPGAVDPAVLRKSSLVTKCPYKGDAEYYDVVVDGKQHHDLVWYYRLPTHESAGIAGLLCFYNEKVDILLDGQLLERPKTHFA